MQTNFDYLKNEEKFSAFSDVAISAEKIVLIDPEACVINCRRAMEFAVKWMYSVENQLDMPYQDNLQSLMNAEDFRDIVGYDIWKRMDYIRRCGNNVAHNNKKFGRAEAMLCLENLSIFLDFLACCYSVSYEEHIFNRQLIEDRISKAKQSKKEAADTKESLLKKISELEKKDLDLQSLIKENMALKEELSARREEQQDSYVPKPLDLSEYKTRKLYIDSMLEDAGWIEGKDWINEYEIPGMPNKSEVGFADYVLIGDDGKILAVIEAKRTCVDVSKGRQQAKLYADLIEQRQKRRPVVFLTNGFETRIIDNQYPERKISVIYSKRDLEKLFNLQTMRSSLKYISVDKNIAGRYYQEGAIKAVCDSFGTKNRRKALLVALQGAIFQLEFEIAYKLQDIAYQTERLIAYRNTLVEHMASKVKELNRENFAVRQHLKYVDTYANEKNYTALTYEDTLVVREELSPLIEPENDNATALRFDALMYGIELAYLIGKKYSRGMHDLISKVSALSSVSNIPEIMVQADLINQILHTDYLDNAGINEFEYIRENLRDLMKYIPKGPKVIYETNFDDEILSMASISC